MGAALCVVVVTAGAATGVFGGRERAAPASRQACPRVSTALRADVDGDGCDDPVEFRDGVLLAGAVRARLGRPGDVVVTGRWGCERATLALLRPATGQVFRFDGWARPGVTVTATAVATLPGATQLRAATAGPRCDELDVVDADGREVRVPVAG